MTNLMSLIMDIISDRGFTTALNWNLNPKCMTIELRKDHTFLGMLWVGPNGIYLDDETLKGVRIYYGDPDFLTRITQWLRDLDHPARF